MATRPADDTNTHGHADYKNAVFQDKLFEFIRSAWPYARIADEFLFVMFQTQRPGKTSNQECQAKSTKQV